MRGVDENQISKYIQTLELDLTGMDTSMDFLTCRGTYTPYNTSGFSLGVQNTEKVTLQHNSSVVHSCHFPSEQRPQCSGSPFPMSPFNILNWLFIIICLPIPRMSDAKDRDLHLVHSASLCQDSRVSVGKPWLAGQIRPTACCDWPTKLKYLLSGSCPKKKKSPSISPRTQHMLNKYLMNEQMLQPPKFQKVTMNYAANKSI